MLKAKSFLWVIPIFGAGLACNSAKFSSSGAETKKSKEEPLTFSCSVQPESIEVGSAANIAVTASKPFGDKLYERIKIGDSVTNLELIAKDGGFQLSDGPNKHTADKAGSYTIEIRRAPDGEVDATCGFTVNAGQCTDAQTAIGANVAFIIDNSYSHSQTDCQNINRQLWNSQRKVLCQDPTNREKAVLAAFDVLDQIGKDANYSDSSASAVAIASFPTANETVNGMQIHTNGWITAKADAKGGIESSLRFTREPIGYTPYGAGMRAAQTLFGSNQNLPTEKAKVAVLVTDGEPTDRNPRETIQIAESLRAQGVEVVTVFVSQGQSRAQRRNSHIDYLRLEDQNWFRQTNGRDNWYDRQVWNNFDSYVSELMGSGANPQLVDKITAQYDPSCKDSDGTVCSRKIIEVSNSAELDKVFRQIVKNSTRCE